MAIRKGWEERRRLEEARNQEVKWKKWGPYLSERQWGTVREDYSENGNAWEYFSHDQARSRAYHWGEDGLAGFSDEQQVLCFALALWNGKDPILKERLFGLTNSEGNHGEDVKEYYFYLDSTPTHSYMKYLYKYPHQAYPYDDIVRTNRRRTRTQHEYELIDTGVFDGGRYFDVFVEYAKADAEDILIRITAANRGPEPARLHLLPTLWFRNTWSWNPAAERPEIRAENGVIRATHHEAGEMYLYVQGQPQLLFTENDTNNARLWNRLNPTPYVKDSFHTALIRGDMGAVNPALHGTKFAPHYDFEVPAGGSQTVKLRLARKAYADADRPLGEPFDEIFRARLAEADTFYDSITPDNLTEDQGRVLRQALAGMLWSKQAYQFDVDVWLQEHHDNPLLGLPRAKVRNEDWYHMMNNDVISMPDKWEYPWYAAWDLAFHTTALALVDLDFAKSQLDLMLRELYMHPNGQIPAYEWNFSDVNPPVHAWATLFLYSFEESRNGGGDVTFLKSCFHKLLLNFTWWVNRKDPYGRNVFEGGFLGLDNIGVFDRSSPLPTGGYLEQADGTAWMALFSQNMFEIASELSRYDPLYVDFAVKFAEHFLWIASAMDKIGDRHDEMWDEQDGFFYDVLRTPDGDAMRLKVRSLVGLLPLCAVTVLDPAHFTKLESLSARVSRFLRRYPEVSATIAPLNRTGVNDRRLLAVLDENKLRRLLGTMLDESEFLSRHGIRSLSKYHEEHPYMLKVSGSEFRVAYLPAESDTGMFGGNSNWRGPIWMPVNLLIIRALLQYYLFYGDDFKVECPRGSGKLMTLFEVAMELCRRLSRIFLRDESGKRPVYGGVRLFQEDPNWRDNILFYEYFHGDNGAGIGASHQTGWTGVVARMIQMTGQLAAEDLLNGKETRPVTSYYEDK